MSELYWINVLGTISDVSVMFSFLFAAMTIIFFVWTIAVAIDENVDDKFHQVPKKCLKYVAILFSVFLTLNIFIPNKNELYAIYGVGTIIDYCENNSNMKELPDNAVKALNAYLKNIEKYNTSNSTENTEAESSNN